MVDDHRVLLAVQPLELGVQLGLGVLQLLADVLADLVLEVVVALLLRVGVGQDGEHVGVEVATGDVHAEAPGDRHHVDPGVRGELHGGVGQQLDGGGPLCRVVHPQHPRVAFGAELDGPDLEVRGEHSGAVEGCGLDVQAVERARGEEEPEAVDRRVVQVGDVDERRYAAEGAGVGLHGFSFGVMDSL